MAKIVDLVYFNAGGGHRAAALALEEVIRMQGRPWQVRLIDLMEVLDPRGRLRKLTGLAQELRLLQAMVRLGHGPMLRTLQQHWLATEPDLVVSLVPHFNRVLCESLGTTLPGVPFATVLTDMADHPPHCWIEPGQRQHLICGTPHAAAQARGAGCPDHRVWPTSGLVLRPAFYRTAENDRSAALKALGLNAARRTGLVMFGAGGSSQMIGIAKALPDVQLILLCGDNDALAHSLRVLPTQAAHAVVAFTPEVRRYMDLADFFIGKPGPGGLSEAVHMGLPILTFENQWTPPRERFNAQWVRERGVGLVLNSVRSIRPGTLEMIGHLPEFQARVRQIDNHAVFEVADILASLMHSACEPARHSFIPTTELAAA